MKILFILRIKSESWDFMIWHFYILKYKGFKDLVID